MSHNDNIPERSARRHVPALTAILVALALAALALFLFGGWGGKDEGAVGELAPATSSAPATSGATTGGTATATAPARTTP